MTDIKTLSRRGFITAGTAAALGGFAVRSAQATPLEIPQWSRVNGPGVAESPYGLPSSFEKDVVRRWLDWMQPARETSISFTPLQDLSGTITPNGLFFERHHAGVPEIDPQAHKLAVHGLVETPLVFSVEELKRFPCENRVHFVECAGNTGLEWKRANVNAVQYSHGMLSNAEWTGVPLKHVLNQCGLKADAKWLLAESADGSGYNRSIPLDKALDDALIAYAQNGEALRPEQGYPLRLLLPGWEGSTNIKWLRRIEVGDQPWHTREETARYSDLLDDGTSRQFTFVQDIKSVITHPCPENPLSLDTTGPTPIRGLAWSGRGKVKAVDVSADGGKTWAAARLVGAVRAKALTAFEFDWQWTGAETIVLSRAIDETDDIQPTIEQLRTQRGDNGIYHNNQIMSWRINTDGSVTNVQLD